ncbi:MAG TPA: nucleotidyltransferase family protein [Vicinamibacterales bacterium]|nr:nucleotidyltransferase family protein [Vicinamibacterales bacterium]
MIAPPASWRPEHALLCQLTRSGVAESTCAALPLLAPSIDWSCLLDTADAHGVSELLLAPLTAVRNDIPSAVLDRVTTRVASVTASNLARTKQTTEVLAILHAHGIQALTYKGPTLAASMYGHLGLRSCADIDILVHQRDAARVRPLLLAEGYTLPARQRHRGGSLLYGLFPAAGRDDTLLPSQPHLAAVDVHVAFTLWTQGIRLDIGELFRRAVTIEIAGSTIPTLCADHLLLVLSIHGMMHGWSVLRHIRDIDAVAGRIENWDVLVDGARSARMLRVLFVALLIAHMVLETKLPPRVLKLAQRDARDVALANGVPPRLFDPSIVALDWDPRPWFMGFLQGSRDRIRFHARDLTYEWFLKWPWDEWLRRRASRSEDRA